MQSMTCNENSRSQASNLELPAVPPDRQAADPGASRGPASVEPEARIHDVEAEAEVETEKTEGFASGRPVLRQTGGGPLEVPPSGVTTGSEGVARGTGVTGTGALPGSLERAAILMAYASRLGYKTGDYSVPARAARGEPAPSHRSGFALREARRSRELAVALKSGRPPRPRFAGSEDPENACRCDPGEPCTCSEASLRGLNRRVAA